MSRYPEKGGVSPSVPQFGYALIYTGIDYTDPPGYEILRVVYLTSDGLQWATPSTRPVGGELISQDVHTFLLYQNVVILMVLILISSIFILFIKSRHITKLKSF